MIQHRGKILPLLIPYIKVLLLDLFCFVSLAMALLNLLQLLRREDKRAFLALPQLLNQSKQEGNIIESSAYNVRVRGRKNSSNGTIFN